MFAFSPRYVIAAAAMALVAGMANAADLAVPEGDVILTVSGAIGKTNVGDTARFDLDGLMALDQTEIETSTIWTDGVQTFTGVSLSVLMDVLGVEDGTILARAINDYAVQLPVSDAVRGGPIIAYHVDGKPMSIRDKGPLWIVYPFDTNPEYRSEVIYSRSIWQLDRIEITE